MAATVEQERLVEVEEAPREAGPGRAPIAERKAFRDYDPDQALLMAPVLQDWVPEGDLAHFVSDLVESSLDLTAIHASYEEERGFPPYDPRLMLKLLIYGYANGICSSRKLERATHRDVAVRMLCAGQHPDYRSIARFRARHLDALASLFVQALRLCKKAGLVKMGTLAIDGTKLRADASRRKATSYERMGKAEERLEAEIAAIEAEVERMLADAEATDRAEDERYGPDRRGDELPDEPARRESRLAAIREAKAALEAEEAEARARPPGRAALRRPRAQEARSRHRPADPQALGAAQLHRPRLEDHEDLRRLLPPVLQRPGRGRLPRPGDRRRRAHRRSTRRPPAGARPGAARLRTSRRSGLICPRAPRCSATPATSPRTTSRRRSSTASTPTWPPAASSTPSRRRPPRAARSPRTPRPSSGWRAS